MIPNSYGRRTDHLDQGNPSLGEKYIKNVVDLFGSGWLAKNDNHRLQALWSRKDALATTELFGLGYAINKLKGKHDTWLRGIAKNIINQPAGAHGFLTEILVCSMFATENGAVRPAPKNKPGYDLEIEFENSFKYLFSIKNHDISKHELLFQKRCSELKSAFARRVKLLGVHASLRVASSKHIEDDEFSFLINFIENNITKFGTYYYRSGSIQISFVKLNDAVQNRAKSWFSNEVMVISPFHKNERKNQIDKLYQAAKNLKDQIPESDDHFRWLWMRIHTSADISALKAAADELVKEGRNEGIDGVFFAQPSVVRSDNSSTINTTLQFAARTDHQGFAKAVMSEKLFMKIEFPVGRTSFETSKLQLESLNGSTPLPDHHYFFQSNDHYIKAKADTGGWHGEINSPASGVHYHLVFETDENELLVQGLFPSSEELLIV